MFTMVSQGCSKAVASISGIGHDPDVVPSVAVCQHAVGNTVQRTAPAQHQVVAAHDVASMIADE